MYPPIEWRQGYLSDQSAAYAQNPLDTFPVTSPWTGKLPTCCQQVDNKSL